MAKCECCGERDADQEHPLHTEAYGSFICDWSIKCYSEMELTHEGRYRGDVMADRILARRTARRDTIPAPSIAGVDIASEPDWSDITLGGVKMPTVIGRTASGEEVVGPPLRKREWQGQDGFYVQNMLKPPPDYADLAAECEKAIRAAIEPAMEFVVDRDSDPVKTGVLKGAIREKLPEMIEITLGFTPQKECRECSRPERPIAATHGELCVYCNHALAGAKRGKLFELRETASAHVMLYANGSEADKDARARLAAAGRKAQPRATAESRMLAKGHPSTWPSQDGEL